MQTESHTSASLSDSPKSDFETIEAAVRLLTKDTRHREMRCMERRSDVRLPFQRQVEVTPLEEDGDSLDTQSAEAITAYTRDISLHGVGLLHDRPLGNNRVLLTFELLGGGRVALVAYLTWSRYLGDFWHASGGILISVVPPVIKAREDWEDEELFG